MVVIAISYGVGVNVMLGAQCAALPELFGARHRYIGVAVVREFSAIIVRGKIAVERHHNAGMTKPHLNGLGWKL